MNLMVFSALWRKGAQSTVLACTMATFIFVSLGLRAQSSDPPTLNNVVIPPSPDASALAEYAEVPVGLYTGVPQVSVPIWNLQGRRLAVPVSLSYHASGIKVDQVASRVGLGWALQAGGTISRTVNGLADEAPNGYFSTAPQLPGNLPMGVERVLISSYDTATYSLVEAMAEGGPTAQPDVYALNFPGGNAQFFFDQNQQPHLIPFGLMDIDRDWNNDTWTITTPDGVKYYFGGSLAREESETFFGQATNPGRADVTAWHLTRIEDPYGDRIDFTYELEPAPACQNLPESETTYIEFIGDVGCSLPGTQYSWGSTCTWARRLKEITSVRGSVRFHYRAEGRADQSGSNALSRIEVLDADGQSLKEFRLYQSYWSNRLLLDEVVESNGCQAKPAQRFFYDQSVPLPPTGSKSRDHWGFYNGASNNSLIPYHQYSNCQSIGTADREPNFQFGKVGMLNRIEHPTGSVTEISYEAHTIWDPNGKDIFPRAAQASATCTNNSPNCSDPGSAPLGVDTLEISHGQCIPFQLTFTNAHNPADGLVRVVNLANGQTVQEWTALGPGSGQYEIYLQPGTYRLEAVGQSGGDQVGVSAQFEEAVSQPQNREIGGVRVKSIFDTDPDNPGNPVQRYFVYEHEGQAGQSSGLLAREPYYLFEMNVEQPDPNAGSANSTPTGIGTIHCQFRGAQSAARALNGNSGGSHIGYGSVKTLYGAGGSNGYSVSTFTTALNHPDRAAEFPFGPDLSRSHLRGMPLSTSVFKADGSLETYSSQSYVFRTENFHESTGHLAAFKSQNLFLSCESCDELILRTYPLRSEWFYSGSQTTRQYAPDGQSYAETVTTYEYDDASHIQPTATRVTDSEGREMVTRVRYAADFGGMSTDPYAVAIQHLKSNFMQAVPVEQTVWQQVPGGNEELLRANLTKFGLFHGKPLPKEVWVLEPTQPGSAFTGASYASGNFVQDVRYRKLETVEAYDEWGNLLQLKRENGPRVAFKWGHGQSLPVAQVADASTAYAAGTPSAWVLDGESAWCGFESGQEEDHRAEDDFWSFSGANFHVAGAHSGKLARRVLAGSPQFGPIRELRPQGQDRRYVFSAWVRTPANYAGGKLILHSKQDSETASGTYPSPNFAPSYRETEIPASGGEWQLLEVGLDLEAIRNAAAIPGSEQLRLVAVVQNDDPNHPLDIDDLRILPDGAAMTNYVYEPMVGQLAVLDENNRATHFGYDALWRLENGFDHVGQVRKQVDYAYAQAELHLHGSASVAYPGTGIQFEGTTSLGCAEGATYQWDFGDGYTVQTPSPEITHAWQAAGNYAVSLTVNVGGHSATGTFLVTIL